jgi:N-acyl-D-aspartate/D-glutamate deacylase
MAEYDVVIRGGTVVDGTGIPRYRADVAIKNGKIANIGGRIRGGGTKEIDASDCIVAPGAIDLHTHYDAQLNWDPYCTPSGWFGVTSLTIGQCGFGFAPTRPADRELNMQMMNRIEAIPLESMRQGMRWDWETFPEYMDSLDDQGLGLNIGALVPFSCLRGYVLGMMDARTRTSVTEEELSEMKQIFREGMKAGAFGIAGNRSAEDHPEDGGYLPSHVASNDEWLALSEVMAEFNVGHIGWDIGNIPIFDDRPQQHELLTEMMKRSGRPLHLILGGPESADWLNEARAQGLPVVEQVQTTQAESTFKLAEYNLYDILPNWVQPLVGSPEERIAKLQDPANRDAMKADIERFKQERHLSINPELARTNWDRVRVYEVVYDRNEKYEGMTINELAQATGKHPVDAYLELSLDEHLQTTFTVPQNPGDSEDLVQRIKGPYGHISLSDGGAHTRYQTSAHWPIYFLSYWVRDKAIMSLEEAHYKMSVLPSWVAGFTNRGSLQVDAWADIMVYELDKLGMLFDGPMWDNDFPGGEKRFIRKPTGLRYTLVNGTVTFEGNDCTGALPGKLLRSYDMVK